MQGGYSGLAAGWGAPAARRRAAGFGGAPSPSNALENEQLLVSFSEIGASSVFATRHSDA